MHRLAAAVVLFCLAAATTLGELWGEETPTPTWTGADVGRVGLAGSFTEADGVFILKGAGGGVYIQGDAFYYVFITSGGYRYESLASHRLHDPDRPVWLPGRGRGVLVSGAPGAVD